MNRTSVASLTLLLVSVLMTQALVADDPPPENLLAFLKPKMSIGIQPIKGTSNVYITIYSPDELKIAQDSRNLELDELAEKYESVRTHIARLTKPGNSVLLIPQGRALFAEVENIGSDYVLVKLLGDEYRRQVVSPGSNASFTESQRRVLSKGSITRIDLDGAGARFAVLPSRSGGDNSQ